FRDELERILAKDAFDVVQMETLFMMNYLDTVREKAPKAVVALRAHNVEHEIWERRAKKEKNFVKKIYLEETAKRLRDFERVAMGKSTFDLVIPITDRDKKQFGEFTKEYVNQIMATVEKKGSTDQKFLDKLAKNGVEDWVIDKFKKEGPVASIKRRIKNQLKLAPKYHISQVGMGFENLDKYMDAPRNSDANLIIFIGALDWTPNQEGLDWFLNKVWPILAKRHPDLNFSIAGRRMPNSYNSKRSKQIKVIGEVENAYTYILSGAIMVVPLLSGSGMRVKIVEGMALGRAIVCTSVAIEGIPAKNGEHCFIEDKPKNFANAITTLLERPNMVQVFGKNARALAKKHFDNKEITKALLNEYQKLAAAKNK
ncbi:MAG: glycosyltransferase family 4 protein, partial [Bacteroidota bacterium]